MPIIDKNEATANRRTVSLRIFQDDGVTPADRAVDFSGLPIIEDAPGSFVLAQGSIANKRMRQSLADDTVEATDTGLNQATFTGHAYQNLDGPIQTTTGLGGIIASTDYWVIYVDANTIAFASSLAHAIAGTRVDLTADITGMVFEDTADTQRGIDGEFLYTMTQAETNVDMDELQVLLLECTIDAVSYARSTSFASIRPAVAIGAGSLDADAFSAEALATLFGVVLIDAASGGTFSATSVDLDAGGSSSLGQFYNGWMLYVVSGTGVGGLAVVDDYHFVSARHVATLVGAGLPTAPDDTSVFALIRSPRYLPGDAVQSIIEGDSSIVEGSATLGDTLRLISALCGFRVTDFRTGILAFKSKDASKTRATVYTDASGRINFVEGDLTP